MTPKQYMACKIMACVSLMSTYVGTMLPMLHDIALEVLPVLQDCAFVIGMASGLVAIRNGLKKKRK